MYYRPTSKLLSLVRHLKTNLSNCRESHNLPFQHAREMKNSLLRSILKQNSAYLGKHIFNDNTCVIKVICTLDSIDSIKSLNRSPQHIFVEVRSGFPSSGFQVPESNFRVPSSGLRTLFHVQVAIINHHEFARIGQNKLYALLEWIIWHPKLRMICKFSTTFDEQGAFIHSTPTPSTKSVHWAPSIKLEEIITPCSDNETVAQRTRQKKPYVSPELPWVQDTVLEKRRTTKSSIRKNKL
ncbi:hypothetical protein Avbf_14023 [Armadillidium vulgare]|nr:hypothetical protein Avbf_14023 [Armadillidium vulgare]